MKNMDINALIEEQLNQVIETTIAQLTPSHSLKEAYLYAVLPAGKLFRPKLIWNTFLDLDRENAANVLNSRQLFEKHPITLLAVAIELHHAYTLVHDDLPAMDNDLMRRGKPSLHAQFGHWQAILIGDGLLNMSYQVLAKINHPEAMNVLKIFSHATGAKGLIHGQVLDLSQEMNLNLENLIRTHELKTARLIQASLSLSAFLTTSNKELACEYWRFGNHLGILFQLLDDLMELTVQNISPHEKEVNPFLKYFHRTFPLIQNEWNYVIKFFHSISSVQLKFMIESYLVKNLDEGTKNVETIISHIENLSSNIDKDFTENDQNSLKQFLSRKIIF